MSVRGNVCACVYMDSATYMYKCMCVTERADV